MELPNYGPQLIDLYLDYLSKKMVRKARQIIQDTNYDKRPEQTVHISFIFFSSHDKKIV